MLFDFDLANSFPRLYTSVLNYDYDQPWVDRLCPGLCRGRPYALFEVQSVLHESQARVGLVTSLREAGSGEGSLLDQPIRQSAITGVTSDRE